MKSNQTHEIINPCQKKKKNQVKRRAKGDKKKKKDKLDNFFFLEDKVKLCYLRLPIVTGSVGQGIKGMIAE